MSSFKLIALRPRKGCASYILKCLRADKVFAYDHDSRDYLSDAFQGTSEMPSQVYNYVWGTYLGAMQDHNWPLAKLTKDVLEQLGITE